MTDAGRVAGNHLDAEALDRYRRRAASPAELLTADAHLAACDRCYEAVRDDTDTIALPPAGDTHLTYEELEAFVDGRAETLDRETVTAHVEHCQLCRSELADVAATRDALAPRPSKPAGQPRRLPR